MKEIILGGIVVQVSDCDFLFVLGQSWSVNAYGRIVGAAGKCNKYRGQQLSRVLAARIGLDLINEIYHEDRNPLNCRRENLRPATNSQQEANKPGKSIFGKGVRPFRGRFQARIKVNQKQKHLGTFDTQEQAQEAYDKAAIEAFGPYACLEVLP